MIVWDWMFLIIFQLCRENIFYDLFSFFLLFISFALCFFHCCFLLSEHKFLLHFLRTQHFRFLCEVQQFFCTFLTLLFFKFQLLHLFGQFYPHTAYFRLLLKQLYQRLFLFDELFFCRDEFLVFPHHLCAAMLPNIFQEPKFLFQVLADCVLVFQFSPQFRTTDVSIQLFLTLQVIIGRLRKFFPQFCITVIFRQQISV